MLKARLTTAFLILLTQQSASAQTDYRIDYRTNQQSGRMLDANNRAFGGRFNSRVTSGRFQFDAGVTANNLIQGNVTGLGGFQGPSPIPGSNSFRVNLPSAGLAGFRARSVDLSQLRGGRIAPSGSAYFDQSNTFADLELIRAQRNIPGSPTLVSPSINVNRGVPGVSGSMFDDDLDNPLDARGSRINNILVGRRNNRVGSVRQVGLDGSEVTARSDFANADVFASIAQSTLFGSPGQLANSQPHGQSTDSVQDIINRSGRDAVSRRMMREDLLNRSKRVGQEAPEGGLQVGRDGRIDPMSAQAFGVTQRTPFGDAPTAGDDLYARMIDSLRDRAFTSGEPTNSRQSRDPRIGDTGRVPIATSTDTSRGFDTLPQSSDRGASTIRNDGRSTNDNRSIDNDGEESSRRRTARYESIIDSPIKTFVTGSQSRVNYHMSLGEAALRDSDFYAAARHFESAMIADRENPLPLLGRGHALAAAGDYMTAVASITMGIKRFPEIAKFDLDLPALVGQSDIFDRRRADLESLLSAREQYELRFLLGYLETYSGLGADGLNDLQKAAKAAPPDSIIAQFPDLLLGRDRPNLAE